ncbi:hypothetical protein ACYE2N_08000 [Flavobacterium sp. MAHUQ-51]|uniref:hypothetical protein n=1 Tax=Flavobacterium sp. GCM10022190 TaxID=3252639 RepID=UPI003619A591
MKFIKLTLLIILFSSCSEKFTTLDEYLNLPVKFAKQKISYPTKDFSITIPKNWFWKVEQYDDKQILLGIDAGQTDETTGFTKIISVQKYKSFKNNDDLKTEFESVKQLTEKNSSEKIVESGKSKSTKFESYFIHVKSDNKKSIETISLLLKSKENKVFYMLNATCQIEDNLETNMSMMIKCLNSFEKN